AAGALTRRLKWSSRIRDASATASSGLALPFRPDLEEQALLLVLAGERLDREVHPLDRAEVGVQQQRVDGRASGSRFSAGTYPRLRPTQTSLSSVPAPAEAGECLGGRES